MLLTEKWDKELNSEKFPTINESAVGDMALILENTKSEEKLLSERSEAGDIAQFTPVLIPLVRRVYPKLIANHIMGVQAMKTPSAYIYNLAYKYLGNGTNGINSTDSAQIIVLDTATTVGATLTGDTSGGTADVLYIEQDGKVALVKTTNGTLLQAEAYNTAAGNITATYSNEAQFGKILSDYTGPYTTADGEDLGSSMNEIGYSIERIMLETSSHKLKGSYTVELIEDMKSMHGLSAEKEMADLMGMELEYETDKKAIDFINNSASAKADLAVDGFGRWDIEKYRSIGIKVSNEARNIGKNIRKGAANVLVTSPKSAVALEAIGSFQTAPVDGKVDSVESGSTPTIGTFDKRYKTVVDNISTGGEYINALYKGASKVDAGCFFGVYSGASVTKVTNQDTGEPAAILSSRYGFIENKQSPDAYASKFAINFSGTVLA